MKPSTGSQNRQEKDVLELDKNDWNLSRSRYWGFRCYMENEDKQEEILVGSVEELYNEIEKSIAAGFKRKSF
jgi:isoleucyl-tRNA synthetase